MNKFITVLLLTIPLSLSACGNANLNDNTSMQHDGGYTKVNYKNEHEEQNVYADDDKVRFGYVRSQKSPVETTRNKEGLKAIDTEHTASVISELVTQLPNVNDASVLVTDEEALIAYDANTNNRYETADQVKKTAMSVVPRYYHVYVSDNPLMMRDIEGFSNLSSNTENIEQVLQNTIRMMLASPQGRDMSESENENGEDKDDMMNEYSNMSNREKDLDDQSLQQYERISNNNLYPEMEYNYSR
ncbi:YhcN/YlaJ family sporulation lipoprotein [Bacillus sp. HMF5848]|uniref:YhcN/YlaJ family sporulation lipoprotein n=1 Tax=Bacillus sp. HMF5848 TaxID=2495421 RepID=UPI0021ADA3DC|nr:YhcN/YlaJ family sporulation lipoprotein [Bacillus sp. HMF5848]